MLFRSESEMLEVVKSINATSCPREDGLPRSFFLTFWDILVTPLRQGLQEIFDTRVMPTQLCFGLVSLIPKGGDTSPLCQWCPITLLPMVYKILAKTLSLRLHEILSDFIH